MATPKNESVRKAFKLLRAFRDADEWLTSAELSRRARLPQASGYRLIQTLEEIGAVIRGPQGRYRPGMLLVQLSQRVEIAELLRSVSHPVLFELASRLSLTVHMGILEHGMVTYVAKVGESAGFAVHTRVGAQLEAYCTGLGKVLLAAMPRRDFDDFLDEGELISLTATEYELLRYLMRNPKRVLSKAQILDRVWNYDFGGQANVVEIYISYLRKKVDAGREPMIHTMRGAGYVLKPVG